MEQENKTVDINDFKKEAKKREWKEKLEKVKQKANDGVAWVFNHPVESAGIATAVSVVLKKTLSYKQTKAEDRRRDVDFYDTRRGRHAISRRPLTRKEQIEVDRRFEAGESYIQILSDMGLLK